MMMKIEMMEAKLLFALCALLLVNMGSAGEAANVSTVQKPEPTKSGNSVTQLPSVAPAASNLSTEPGTNMTGTFSTSAPHTNHPSSNHSTPLHEAPPSSTPSTSSDQNKTSSPTPVSTPVATMTPAAPNTSAPNATAPNATAPNATSPNATSPNATAPNATAPNATASNATASNATAPNATSSRGITTSQPSTNTNQSSHATTKPSPVTTTAPLNITSTHSGSSSQLTMQGSNSHDSPGLDPLLVGLVSAFVITAIVITLLLFLKFRRRQSGPRFHRLQDLPMDDMMEETPLSMYTY
ncbi:PREDICTED: probable maltase-glucoamylase 2 [Poecilia mexicana]|uniref:Uncharacterized protein n=1 Tax=Poecilia mexicana TaxID=48701 RepID=A0A3B3WHK4_9TELE|nr:PREDICTED: probable maltase-glucoamylase 2 [Poecilia mexicana]